MDTVTFRRSGVDEYAILLDGSPIGTVAKTRSVDLLTGAARQPVWVAQARAAHPFGVTETHPAPRPQPRRSDLAGGAGVQGSVCRQGCRVVRYPPNRPYERLVVMW